VGILTELGDTICFDAEKTHRQKGCFYRRIAASSDAKKYSYRTNLFLQFLQQTYQMCIKNIKKMYERVLKKTFDQSTIHTETGPSEVAKGMAEDRPHHAPTEKQSTTVFSLEGVKQ
jgi:hypothetical protein